MPKMIKIHVTYGETKRVISHQKGGEVQGLRHTFLQVFSDVLSSEIAPAHVTFQRYDDKFEDYVELQNNERLEDDIKIRALISKQTARSSPSEAEPETKHQHWHHCHLTMPRFSCICLNSDLTHVGPGAPIFIRPHLIKKNTTYRLWNSVSRQNDSFIQRDPNTNIVNCSGSFNSGINTVMDAIDETRQRTFYVALTFSDKVANKNYAMTGNGKGQDITALEVQSGDPLGDESVYEPLYYWSYTMFRNKSYNTLYLGCDNTGKTTLVENLDLDYPNPQALFVLNKLP
ncbi:hypothetical protein OS493_011208 [Desmophyllum pertusum]|uniref:Uncharacterized protein n=1 Tax=Desmophyllum pertusum TaxID=174260 RepID=A0A9X0CTG8_9CNID|nr:hypothetical protein OS493_011208 [Desmophyllum pertusum]